MKKQWLSLISLTIILLLAACGDNTEPSNHNDNNTNEAAAKENNDVQENDNTDKDEEKNEDESSNDTTMKTVRLPLDFIMLEGEDEEEIESIKKEMEAEGAENFSIESDELIFEMSQEEYDKMLEEMRVEIAEGFNEIAADDTFPSIEKIEANDDFTHVQVTVDKIKMEESPFEGFALLGVFISSSMFQGISGIDADAIETKVDMIDSETNEIYESVTFPDELDL